MQLQRGCLLGRGGALDKFSSQMDDQEYGKSHEGAEGIILQRGVGEANYTNSDSALISLEERRCQRQDSGVTGRDASEYSSNSISETQRVALEFHEGTF